MKGLAGGRATIPIGPYLPLQDKPEIFRLSVEDETVVGVDIDLGYNHRGIEKLSQEKPFDQVAFLVERICAACSVSHSLAYSNAVEDILGIEPPVRALYIRTTMAEIERIHSHLLWLGLMGYFSGYNAVFMSAFRCREPVLDMLEAVTGNRNHSEMIKPGGVRQDIDEADGSGILKVLSDLAAAVEILRKIALDNPIIQARFKGVGVIGRQDAISWGVVGPVARASGIDIDARKNDSYAVYDRIKWRMVVQPGGDVFARMVVRILEIYESIEIIKQCLKKMPKGLIDVRIKEVPAGEGIGMAESPGGECLHYVRSDGTNAPVRHKIRSASYMNIPAVKAAVVGQQVADATVILASLDPCYCCAERMAVAD